MSNRSRAFMVLLAATVGVMVATPKGREALTNPLEYLLYGPETGELFCMVGEPRDLEGYRDRADAIVRVRLGSRFPAQRFVDRDELWAFREATVLETFKTGEKGPAIGDSIVIVEWRGWEAPYWVWLDWFSPLIETLLPRHDWILFLEWDGEIGSVLLFGQGAFEIEDGLIDMDSYSEWAQSWRGKPASALVDALRSDGP